MGYNLYSYCLNNPISFEDKEGTYADAAGWWGATMWWLCGADTVLPIGDILYFGILATLGVIGVGTAKKEYPIAYTKEKVVTKESTKEKELADSKVGEVYTYWKADLVNKQIVIGEGLSFTKASVWVAQGNNIMCATQDAAKALLIVNGYKNAVGPEKGIGEGFFWHYHPTRNHTGSSSVHIWFIA